MEPTQEHLTYRARLQAFFSDDGNSPELRLRLMSMAHVVQHLAVLDLGPARPTLKACYRACHGGKKPRDPVAMLRCLILMIACQETRFNRWARKLKSYPEFAMLSGFSPGKVPGVGTLYDFCHRILDGPRDSRHKDVERPSARFKKSGGVFRRNLSKEKLERKALTQAELTPTQNGPAKVAVKHAIDGMEQELPQDFQNRIETLLFTCGVVPSMQAGLLGPPDRLDIAGDGTTLYSNASQNGKATCTCRKDGKAKDCTCDRTYSDPEATFGWDSNHETYFFGYRLHVWATQYDTVELPIHLFIAPAYLHDLMAGIETISRLNKLVKMHLPGAHIRNVINDAAYDADAWYTLLGHNHMRAITAWNPAHKTPVNPNGIPRDEWGVPLCKGGLPMRLQQLNLAKGETVYNCPIKRPGREKGRIVFRCHTDECPQGALCEPNSVMGPLVHLKHEDHPRLNIPVPHNSKEFIELYNKRTCTERFNSKAKVAHELGNRPYRRQHLFLIAALSVSLNMHARAQAIHRFGDKPKTWEDLMAQLAPSEAAAKAA